jgi:5,10-methylene-tetrahydrofolate dehydrogenase/methenyl tetrahydrofolate cyclohydrolase
MRILNGAELRDFIKERQVKQVRNLRQSWKVFPKLVIFYASNSPVIETYIRLKKTYGEDILIDVEPIRANADELQKLIKNANQNETIHGIIVQLPLENHAGERLDNSETEEILATISPEKDVDSLNGGDFDAATATAVNWLISGYNIELKGQRIAIIGNGAGITNQDLRDKFKTVFEKLKEAQWLDVKEFLQHFERIMDEVFGKPIKEDVPDGYVMNLQLKDPNMAFSQ